MPSSGHGRDEDAFLGSWLASASRESPGATTAFCSRFGRGRGLPVPQVPIWKAMSSSASVRCPAVTLLLSRICSTSVIITTSTLATIFRWLKGPSSRSIPHPALTFTITHTRYSSARIGCHGRRRNHGSPAHSGGCRIAIQRRFFFFFVIIAGSVAYCYSYYQESLGTIRACAM